MSVHTSKHAFPAAKSQLCFLKHHLGMGKAALGFWLDKIRTPVSMQKTPIRFIWAKCCGHSSAFILIESFFILAGYETNHEISDQFGFGQDRTLYLY